MYRNCRNAVRVCLFIILLPFLSPTAAGTQEQRSIWQTEFIDLAVEFDPAQGIMKGDAEIRLQSSGSGVEDIILNLNHELTVISVNADAGRILPFKRNDDRLSIHPPKQLSALGVFTIQVHYQGSFHERVPELDLLNAWIGTPVSYAFSSSRWYPQMTGPLRHCRGRIAYLVPAGWVVASVGRLTATEALPGGKRYIFTIESPSGFSFAAAAFAYQRRSIDGQEMGVFLLNGGREKVNFFFENCVKIVRFLKKYYGFFPYEGYSLIELPADLLGKAGGGSYDGLTFFSPAILPERFFFTPAFGHEIGHCWWGNCVRGAEGPVIDEGLAQMSMGLYIEHALGEKIFRQLLKDGMPELLFVQSARTYFRALQSPKCEGNSLLGLMMRGEDLELGIPVEDKRNTLHMLANSKGFFSYAMLRDLIGPVPSGRGCAEHWNVLPGRS